MVRQLKASEVREVKIELAENQLHKCLLCETHIDPTDPQSHLDHCHQTGRVRGVLCRKCNTLEGIIHHKFVRSGLRGAGIDYTSWLIKMANYLTEDYSDNDFHPKHRTDQAKLFMKLSLADQKEHLRELGIPFPEKSTKKDLEKIYKKSFYANPRCDFDNGKYDAQ